MDENPMSYTGELDHNNTVDTTTINVNNLLEFTVKNKGSDLHISAGLPPMIRIDGDVKKLKLPTLDKKTAEKILYEVMNDQNRKNFEETNDADFSITIPRVGRFRVNVFMQDRGIAAVFRTIPTIIPSMEDLGMGNIFKELSEKQKGIVLVTGPTGSGKSTTLAAMIDYINSEFHKHILTLEDPIEFVHESKRCMINQREVHRDTRSFGAALRSALREDPDVILVGEMRDPETIRLALTAAETGHLVFGTLHTSSAPKTVDRIIDVFPAEEKSMVRSMLSESLQAVVCQTLIKRKGGGRVAAHEIMVGTPAIRNLIREDKIAQMTSAMQTGSQYGMQTLDQHINELLSKNIIEYNDAITKANDKKAIEQRGSGTPPAGGFGGINRRHR